MTIHHRLERHPQTLRIHPTRQPHHQLHHIHITTGQLDSFGDAVASVRDAIGRTPQHVHAANSAGILAHERSWLTMVRAGIIGYGALPGPTAARSIPLSPGLSWVSRVSFLKTVESGATVSYGRTWTAPRTTRIATVPVGYGDGLSRFLSNNGRFLVNGRSYPIVGRVCMDQTMIDVGDGKVFQSATKSSSSVAPVICGSRWRKWLVRSGPCRTSCTAI